jgi:hypothetical protein
MTTVPIVIHRLAAGVLRLPNRAKRKTPTTGMPITTIVQRSFSTTDASRPQAFMSAQRPPRMYVSSGMAHRRAPATIGQNPAVVSMPRITRWRSLTVVPSGISGVVTDATSKP